MDGITDLAKKIKGYRAIWLTTEPHKRSTELAVALNSKMYALLQSDSDIPVRIFRYVYYVYKTVLVLIANRPQVVFVQNPSIFLAFIACFLKTFFKYKLVIDRHSNFKLDKLTAPEFKWRLFHCLSKYTTRQADLTVVTNNFFKDFVDSMGGKGFILQDKFPQMNLGEMKKLKGVVNIVVVSTFSDDEPIEAVFEAAKKLPADWFVHVTGKYQGKGKFAELIKDCPSNVILTGYVSEKEYQSLLLSVDVVVVLTTEENLLTCGAYEAVSLGKALVLSDTEALRHYFRYGVVYSQNTPAFLRENFINAVKQKEQLEVEILQLREELEVEWQGRFAQLVAQISSGG